MIFYRGTAADWLQLSEREKKQLIGPELALQKQKKTASRKEKTA